jgi:hypothetical protein
MSPHFPYECSDEELQEKIAEYAERVQSSSTTETLQWWPLLQLGLIEQQCIAPGFLDTRVWVVRGIEGAI